MARNGPQRYREIVPSERQQYADCPRHAYADPDPFGERAARVEALRLEANRNQYTFIRSVRALKGRRAWIVERYKKTLLVVDDDGQHWEISRDKRRLIGKGLRCQRMADRRWDEDG